MKKPESQKRKNKKKSLKKPKTAKQELCKTSAAPCHNRCCCGLIRTAWSLRSLALGSREGGRGEVEQGYGIGGREEGVGDLNYKNLKSTNLSTFKFSIGFNSWFGFGQENNR